MSPVGAIFVSFPPKTGTNMLHPRPPPKSLNWSVEHAVGLLQSYSYFFVWLYEVVDGGADTCSEALSCLDEYTTITYYPSLNDERGVVNCFFYHILAF